jgi:hypothetical protein
VKKSPRGGLGNEVKQRKCEEGAQEWEERRQEGKQQQKMRSKRAHEETENISKADRETETQRGRRCQTLKSRVRSAQ